MDRPLRSKPKKRYVKNEKIAKRFRPRCFVVLSVLLHLSFASITAAFSRFTITPAFHCISFHRQKKKKKKQKEK